MLPTEPLVASLHPTFEERARENVPESCRRTGDSEADLAHATLAVLIRTGVATAHREPAKARVHYRSQVGSGTYFGAIINEQVLSFRVEQSLPQFR
jgi:hypothetical protein